MLDYIKDLHPIVQVLIATGFTWGVTALGASFVFVAFKPNDKVFEAMLGFAAGVMIAASYWSLLEPSIELSSNMGVPKWFPPAIGFLLGCFFLWIVDKIMPHLHLFNDINEAEGPKTKLSKNMLLVLAITLHNIPEGLAVGVAFGAAANDFNTASLAGAMTLALGIGLQNFPEGFAVSMPLRSGGLSKYKSFWFGQLSGFVEPLSGLLGVVAVTFMQPILPYALAFAAGAMIYVVIEEVIPESQKSGDTDLATLSTILGFVVMMILDVALG